MMEWTEQQKLAIYESGKNIIVSAGAGSGKTTVLTARVIEKLKSNCQINELLILTFTKAAAKEMKDRIRKEILKNDLLKDQLPLLDSAYITTFDSFALSLVKRYYYILNVKKDISIIDSNIIKMEQIKILDQIFDDLYLKEDENFLKLINDFCVKDDKEIKKALLSLYNKLDLVSDKKEYLENYLDNYFSSDFITKTIEEYLSFFKEQWESLKELYNTFLSLATEEYIEKCDSLNKLMTLDDYEVIRSAIKDVKLERLPNKSSEDLKQIKDKINSKLEEIKSFLNYSLLELKEQFTLTKPYIEAIIAILLELNEKVMELKKKHDLYEFADIASLAIKLVKENPDIAKDLKNEIKEIMIDEYQDTSSIQEELISLISHDNVYMVGDIKQSIYRFRNANPNLFKQKYDAYALNKGGIKIDLTKNYRSREEVVNNINAIFNLVMDDEVGSASYQETHQMEYGNKDYSAFKYLDNYNYQFLTYRSNNSGSSDKEKEIFIIARDILRRVNNKEKIYDKETKELRECQFKDFAILVDKSSDFDLYRKIFSYLNIPLSVQRNQSLKDSYEINIISNLFSFLVKVAKNEIDDNFKYLFISLARSFLFDYDDDTIFTIFRDNSFLSSPIYLKAKNILNQGIAFTSLEYFDALLKEYCFVERLTTIGFIKESMAKIVYLRDNFANLSKLGYDLEDCANYLKTILEEDLNIEYPTNNVDENSVQLMTIHTSKGLEFNICYFPNLANKFNEQEYRSRFIFDLEYGFIVPFYDDGIKNTFIKEMYLKKLKIADISEKIRLFYVALTRVKEQMIFVLKEYEETKSNTEMVTKDERLSYNKFLSLIKSVDGLYFDSYKLLDDSEIGVSKDYLKNIEKEYKNLLKNDQEMLKIKDLNLNQEYYENTYLVKKAKIISKNEKEHLERGTYLHQLLEVIDFKSPNYDLYQVKEEDKLIIERFLSSDLMKDLEKAKIYKEFSFYDQQIGIIDLLLEYDNHFTIVDYKLKNISDEEYEEQLARYYAFLKKKTNKEIRGFLFSLLEGNYKRLF